MYNASNGAILMDDSTMDYICFGRGKLPLIIIPGLGDGLITVKGKAAPFAMMFKAYAARYRVYLFSRKRPLPEHWSTRDMARDLADAMDLLGLAGASVVGISQGGMIAQHLAVDRPDLVRQLVLVVSCAKATPMMLENAHAWMELAQSRKYKALVTDINEKSYTTAFLERWRKFFPLLCLNKPKSFDRFLTQAEACIQHDASDRLAWIHCPTLVIGGEQDVTLGPDGSRELARGIPGSKLYLYPHYGHGLYQEAHDFNNRILAFLRKTSPQCTCRPRMPL